MEPVTTVLCWLLLILVVIPSMIVGAIVIAAGLSVSVAFIWVYGFVMEALGWLIRRLTNWGSGKPTSWDTNNSPT